MTHQYFAKLLTHKHHPASHKEYEEALSGLLNDGAKKGWVLESHQYTAISTRNEIGSSTIILKRPLEGDRVAEQQIEIEKLKERLDISKQRAQFMTDKVAAMVMAQKLRDEFWQDRLVKSLQVSKDRIALLEAELAAQKAL